MNGFKIGDILKDVNERWNKKELNIVFLILSADHEKGKKVVKMAEFMLIGSQGYAGAPIREFHLSEFDDFEKIGELPKFNTKP